MLILQHIAHFGFCKDAALTSITVCKLGLVANSSMLDANSKYDYMDAEPSMTSLTGDQVIIIINIFL